MISGRVFKARHSQTKLSKNLQHQLLDVLARTEIKPQSHSIQPSPAVQDRNYNAPAASSKRPFDATSAIDSVPAKKCCLTQTSARSPTIEGAAEQQEGQGAYETLETSLQQPTPKRPKHSYALFLENFVDLADPVDSWLEYSGDLRCRSDTRLYRSSSSPISRPLTTTSVPEMGRTGDAEGFTLPPTPLMPESPSGKCRTQSNFTEDTSILTRSSGMSLVEDPLYRIILAENNIYMMSRFAQLPDHITALVDDMKKGRASPEPTLDEIRQDPDLAELEEAGAGEQDVENYFRSKLFPFPRSWESLRRSDKQQMVKRAVPSTGSQYKISTPAPDMLYGYKRQAAFPVQQSQLHSTGNEAVANSSELIYPFLAIEFKGDGPPGCGSLWVATNQCIGASASCVHIAERLNQQLRRLHGDDAKSINSAIFSVAMNATEARLYVAWKENKVDFCMAKVASFYPQVPESHVSFRRHIRNIIDWGKGKRLREIKETLNSLQPEKREKTPGVVKSSARSSLSSASGSTKRLKTSPLSTLGNN